MGALRHASASACRKMASTRLVGEIAGDDMRDFFARYVDGTDDPPLDALLDAFGVEWHVRAASGTEAIAAASRLPAPPPACWLGAKVASDLTAAARIHRRPGGTCGTRRERRAGGLRRRARVRRIARQAADDAKRRRARRRARISSRRADQSSTSSSRARRSTRVGSRCAEEPSSDAARLRRIGCTVDQRQCRTFLTRGRRDRRQFRTAPCTRLRHYRQPRRAPARLPHGRLRPTGRCARNVMQFAGSRARRYAVVGLGRSGGPRTARCILSVESCCAVRSHRSPSTRLQRPVAIGHSTSIGVRRHALPSTTSSSAMRNGRKRSQWRRSRRMVFTFQHAVVAAAVAGHRAC